MRQQHRNRIRRQPHRVARARSGSVLLDLFLATVIFVTCMLAIGQLGTRSLQIAERNSLERVACIKAESVLALEGLTKEPKDRTWQESFMQVPMKIQVVWKDSATQGVQECAVQVTAMRGSAATEASVSLSRMFLVETLR